MDITANRFWLSFGTQLRNQLNELNFEIILVSNNCAQLRPFESSQKKRAKCPFLHAIRVHNELIRFRNQKALIFNKTAHISGQNPEWSDCPLFHIE